MSKENRVSDERLSLIASGIADRLGAGASGAPDLERDIASAITELLSLRSKPVAGVEVKPLEWSKLYTDGNGYSATDARCLIGLYSAYRLSGDTAWVLEFGNRRVGDFDQLAQAQEAAQTDYSKCILSSLSLPAQEPTAYGVFLNDGRFMDIASDSRDDAVEMAEIHYAQDNYLIRPLYASPQPEAVITEARFLVDRLDDFERGSLSDGIEDACRDFDGHVSPAIERLRAALKEA